MSKQKYHGYDNSNDTDNWTEEYWEHRLFLSLDENYSNTLLIRYELQFISIILTPQPSPLIWIQKLVLVR